MTGTAPLRSLRINYLSSMTLMIMTERYITTLPLYREEDLTELLRETLTWSFVLPDFRQTSRLPKRRLISVPLQKVINTPTFPCIGENEKRKRDVRYSRKGRRAFGNAYRRSL